MLERMPPSNDLDDLFVRARVVFEALSPDQQAHQRHEQRINFAAGNVALSWPDPRPGEEDNLDKARRLVRDAVGLCPCGACGAQIGDRI